MKNILIVDDEILFLNSLQEGLLSYSTEYHVLTASNGKEAIALLDSAQIDLLLTDLKMPVMDGFALLAHIINKRMHIPAIVMTAFNSTEIEERLSRIGTFHFLEKPLDFNALVDKIDDALKEVAKGHIAGIALASFLQLVEMDKKTCTLQVKADEKLGRFYFKTGLLIDADAGDLVGLEAAYNIVAWNNPEIEVIGVCNAKEQRINESINSILLEAYRLHDEKKQQDIETSTDAEANEDEFELMFNFILDEPENIGTENPVITQPKEEQSMATESVMTKLKEFSGIDGFAGVGIFTPAGENMGVLVADPKVKLNEIGVLANNVLLDAQKASLEMGAGIGALIHIEAEHAHILARCLNEGSDPLKTQPGKAHIHLVLVLASDASIGMAKLKMNKITPSLADDFRF